MKQVLNVISSVLTARVEFQGAVLATISLLVLFDVIRITEQQLAGIILFMTTWMAFASMALFKKSLDDWNVAIEAERSDAVIQAFGGPIDG